MPTGHAKSGSRGGTVSRFAAAALAAAIALPAAGAERVATLDPAATRVTFTLGTTFHEVHGTFAPASGSVRFDRSTGEASGTLAVDARSGETGNARRDRKMHESILESARFPSIAFRVERVEGRVPDAGRGDIRLAGVLSLHGADHPMTVPAAVDVAGDRFRAEVRLAIPYVEWGLEDPSFLFVRAEKSVAVTVLAEGRLAEASSGGAP